MKRILVVEDEPGIAFALEAALRDPSLVADWDPGARDLDGYLYPETYHFASGMPAERAAQAMIERFRTVWSELDGSSAASNSSREVPFAAAS